MANDATAVAVIEKQEISPEQIEEVAGSVLSMKVQGVKPNGIA